jgi:protein-L-isoaspartate(D-aspartate) O-methyltransferase
VAYIDFIEQIHGGTKRDYLQRVIEADKATLAEVAKQFGEEYFDGDRLYGYGGYRYDGRWRSFARKLTEHYSLAARSRVLDVGCAKGFLVHDFLAEVPGIEAAGCDISSYAIREAMPEVQDLLQVASAVELPYPDDSFDLVVSINTLHNLRLPDLARALREMERISRGDKYVIVDGYRNEREKVNLMYWQITCECLFTPDEWQWLFDQVGYTGDFACVFFE